MRKGINEKKVGKRNLYEDHTYNLAEDLLKVYEKGISSCRLSLGDSFYDFWKNKPILFFIVINLIIAPSVAIGFAFLILFILKLAF